MAFASQKNAYGICDLLSKSIRLTLQLQANQSITQYLINQALRFRLYQIKATQ
jgi:hypothetical protein